MVSMTSFISHINNYFILKNIDFGRLVRFSGFSNFNLLFFFSPLKHRKKLKYNSEGIHECISNIWT